MTATAYIFSFLAIFSFILAPASSAATDTPSSIEALVDGVEITIYDLTSNVSDYDVVVVHGEGTSKQIHVKIPTDGALALYHEKCRSMGGCQELVNILKRFFDIFRHGRDSTAYSFARTLHVLEEDSWKCFSDNWIAYDLIANYDIAGCGVVEVIQEIFPVAGTLIPMSDFLMIHDNVIYLSPSKLWSRVVLQVAQPQGEDASRVFFLPQGSAEACSMTDLHFTMVRNGLFSLRQTIETVPLLTHTQALFVRRYMLQSTFLAECKEDAECIANESRELIIEKFPFYAGLQRTKIEIWREAVTLALMPKGLPDLNLAHTKAVHLVGRTRDFVARCCNGVSSRGPAVVASMAPFIGGFLELLAGYLDDDAMGESSEFMSLLWYSGIGDPYSSGIFKGYLTYLKNLEQTQTSDH